MKLEALLERLDEQRYQRVLAVACRCRRRRIVAHLFVHEELLKFEIDAKKVTSHLLQLELVGLGLHFVG